jgi:large subunit ribosomal protein L37Ae
MAEEVKLGTVKRFGARYGSTIRERVGKIELLRNGPHTCPYCHDTKVKRKAVGIWFCSKCNVKFTGKAYYLAKPQKVEEEEIKVDDGKV